MADDLFEEDIPESLRGYLTRLISMSKIPEEFQEAGGKCLLELLMQPENFTVKDTSEDEKLVTRFNKFSLNKLPNQFLQSKKSRSNPKKADQHKMKDFKFKSKREIFYFLTRLHQLERKHEQDLKSLRRFDTSDDAEDEEPILEWFDEECVLVLPAGRANVTHEIRRIMEQTDQFMETPSEEPDLDVEAEIHRLNFGGMPVRPKCLGDPVRLPFPFAPFGGLCFILAECPDLAVFVTQANRDRTICSLCAWTTSRRGTRPSASWAPPSGG